MEIQGGGKRGVILPLRNKAAGEMFTWDSENTSKINENYLSIA